MSAGLLGCGDHSCVFAKPNGVGTNGGCRCLSEIHRPLAQAIKNHVSRLDARLAAAETRVAELEGQVEAWKHHANEWADAATNGPQWVKNIRDGINTVDEALAHMAADFQHCRDTHPDHLRGEEVKGE